jgi:hypothetical protein
MTSHVTACGSDPAADIPSVPGVTGCRRDNGGNGKQKGEKEVHG